MLADAIAYAAARLRPTVLVDIATLTGAMKVALGLRTGGLFATTDELADGLTAAGDAHGRAAVAVADAGRVRVGAALAGRRRRRTPPGNPGAITAALFLRPFAKDVPWAHLDVAGPARAAEDDGLLSPRRDRLRRPAALVLGGVAGVTEELVLPFVVRIERDAPPVADRRAGGGRPRRPADARRPPRPEWAEAVAAWDGQRIRKVVRRARGRRVAARAHVDGLDVAYASAELRVYPPVPVDAWPAGARPAAGRRHEPRGPGAAAGGPDPAPRSSCSRPTRR